MKINEFRQLSNDDLIDKISTLEENLFRLRCNKTIGQLEDTSVIKTARKDIARAKTVLNENKRSE
ncbi:MAG: 50S ribosomal protein L29 [Deltaproteobacteria bacterium]|jgi:large subunit ribosomal protein L29|nr:50S ribosomal protein L29 [Deltaproteobacteria bacterium]MBT4722375.1 50S ribosomal protein L29 [Candidatus Falkowbacteria bacterium]